MGESVFCVMYGVPDVDFPVVDEDDDPSPYVWIDCAGSLEDETLTEEQVQVIGELQVMYESDPCILGFEMLFFDGYSTGYESCELGEVIGMLPETVKKWQIFKEYAEKTFGIEIYL